MALHIQNFFIDFGWPNIILLLIYLLLCTLLRWSSEFAFNYYVKIKQIKVRIENNMRCVIATSEWIVIWNEHTNENKITIYPKMRFFAIFQIIKVFILNQIFLIESISPLFNKYISMSYTKFYKLDISHGEPDVRVQIQLNWISTAINWSTHAPMPITTTIPIWCYHFIRKSILWSSEYKIISLVSWKCVMNSLKWSQIHIFF